MFSGSIVALITPMTATGEIDWAALESLIEWHVQSGTHGIVPVGTTGESATLTFDEHKAVVERTIKCVAGRIPVIAGTGANATAEAIEFTAAAAQAGADACLLVTPYYNKPPQEGLYQHYCAVAAAVDVPIVLYNVPARTACDMLPETVARLAEVDNIIGIKEACGDAQRVAAIRALVDDRFIILSGEDAQTLAMMELGAVGTISVTANVLPKQMSEFCTAYLERDVGRAKQLDDVLQPIHEVLFVETSPIPTKWALSAMGKVDVGIRLPLVPLSEPRHDEVRQRLEAVGAL
ncbi:MAG: 4-hydroxy-tetrahydrodipicolinate synthase [Gammaproteobacteria bacterium]|nr:4-hydroxy-tetrahydrodipicolinate synthase [Gammaproteobacteria bacterium]